MDKKVIIGLERGDMIIWDSGFGYEIGFFVRHLNEDEKFLNYGCIVQLVTGVVTEKTTRPLTEIELYSEKLAQEKADKYWTIQKKRIKEQYIYDYLQLYYNVKYIKVVLGYKTKDVTLIQLFDICKKSSNLDETLELLKA